MPVRLTELTKGYPYSKQISPEDDVLPRPRISTRSFDALYVRLDSQLADHTAPRPNQHPLRIIVDAFRSEVEPTNEDYVKMWDAIKTVASGSLDTELAALDTEAYPDLSRVFGEETITLLSLIPADNSHNVTITLQPPIIRAGRPTRRRSQSVGHPNGKTAKLNGNTYALASSTVLTATAPKDWSDFSTVGFSDNNLGSNFAATLLDTDIEVTNPPSRRPSRRQRASPDRGRRSSLDNPNLTSSVVPRSPKQWNTKATVVGLTKVDEAFVDFWSDGLVDPIAADWPNFVLCRLKPLPDMSAQWLVIEQTFTRPPPPPEPAASPSARRASSPRPSLRSEVSGRKSSTFAGARKRFSFFSAGSRESVVATHETRTGGRKKAGKAPKTSKVGEMGEMLPEVEEKSTKEPSPAPPVPVKDSAEPAAPPTALGLIGVADGTEAAPANAADVVDAKTEAEPAPSQPTVQDAPVVPSRAGFASPISPMDTPTAADFPAVPLDTSRPLPTPAAEPTVTEPIRAEDAAGNAEIAVPDVVTIPADDVDPSSDAAATLPAAPQSVVLAGETPGPQVALNTSDPVARAEVSNESQVEIVQESPSDVQQVAEPAVDTAPAKTDEVTPEKHVEPATDSHDVIAEAAGSVIEQTSAIPADSNDTLDDIATARPSVGVVVSSPSSDAARAISSSAEVQGTSQDTLTQEPAAGATDVEAPQIDEHNGAVPAVEAGKPAVDTLDTAETLVDQTVPAEAEALEKAKADEGEGAEATQPQEPAEPEHPSTEVVTAPTSEITTDADGASQPVQDESSVPLGSAQDSNVEDVSANAAPVVDAAPPQNGVHPSEEETISNLPQDKQPASEPAGEGKVLSHTSYKNLTNSLSCRNRCSLVHMDCPRIASYLLLFNKFKG